MTFPRPRSTPALLCPRSRSLLESHHFYLRDALALTFSHLHVATLLTAHLSGRKHLMTSLYLSSPYSTQYTLNLSLKHCQASIPKHRADCAGSRTNGLEGKRRVVSTAACHPWVQDTRPLLFSLCSRKWVCLTRTACPLGGSGRISSPLFGDGVCQPKSRRQIPQSR